MKKYYLSARFKLIYGSVFLSPLIIIIPLFLFPAFTIADTWGYGLLAFVVTMEILGAVFQLSQEYILLSEEGILYHSLFGFSIRATWSNIESVTSQKSLLSFGRPEILIVAPAEFMRRSSLGSIFKRAAPLKIAKGFIPINRFADNWRDSELGREIGRHALHVLLGTTGQAGKNGS